jgi:hypothetical protein
MSRTEINVAKGLVNSDAIMTVTAIQPGATGTSGYVIEDSTFDNRLGLVVTNSGSATGAIEITASDFYENAGEGKLSITVGGSVTKLVGPLDGMRFRQASGDINVDSVGVTGSIYAVEIG